MGELIKICLLFQLRNIGEKKIVKTCCELDIHLSTRARSYIPGDMKMVETFTKKNNQIAIAINIQKPTIFMFQGPLEPSSRSWIVLCNLYFYPNTFHQYIILHHFWNTTVVFF